MGLDNKLIFPDFQTLTLDKDNPTVYYTREASGEIYRIDGRSEVKQETTWKKGFMVSADGYVQNSANTALEGAINISNFTTPLTIRLGNTIPTYNTVVFLNSEKLHISTVDHADLNALEIPSGAKYLKLSYNHAVHTGIKEPEVYINDVLVYGINEVANVGLLNVSTNKYDINITSSKNYTLGLINEGDYDVYVDTKYNNYFIKNIPVVPNSKITITKGASKGVQFTVYKYNANRVEGSGEVIEQIYGNVDIQTISIPSNCESITLLIRDTTEHPTGLYLQEGDKFVDYVQTSTKTISIEQPLRQANNNVYDSIYRFGDGGYYLFKRVGVRSYQDGDYDNPLVITDGVNTNYDLGIADYTEVQLTDFDPSIDFFGTDTTFSCDSMMPSIEVKVPIDYAYNESKRKYVDEEINIDTVDVDSRKDIEIVSIEGQTYENLLQEPLVQGTAINPVELTGRECVYTGGENTTVPVKEITGDTYINLLEDKIKNTTIKPVASYNGESVVDGKTQFMKLEDDMLEDGILNVGTGLEETSEYKYKRTKFIKVFSNGKQLEMRGYYINQNSQLRSNISFFFYDKDKNYISRAYSGGQYIHRIDIPDNSKYFRMQSDYFNGSAQYPNGGVKYEIFIPFEYNLDSSNKVTIDEIKGNTKLYHNSIPIADPSTNLWTTGDPVLQEVNQDGAYGDTSKKSYLGTATPIYVGNVENQQVYVYVLDSDGNNVSTTFAFRFYDKNLKFQNISNVATGNGGIQIDGSKTPYFLVNINGGDIIQQEGLYQIVMTTTSITTFPATYVAPTILGSKTFPIQSVGELYVDEQGEPILDDDNNEQYKIDIINSNNIWDGKKFNANYSNGANGFGDQSYYNHVKLQDNYSMKIIKSQATTRFYSGTIIVDNILNYSKLYASCKYINDNGLKDNSQMWYCDFYDVNGNFLSRVRQIIPINSSNLYQTSFDVPSGAYTARLFIQGDINKYISAEFYITDIKITYKEEKTVTPIKTTIKSILLPQPLRSHVVKDGVSNELYKCCDRLYWDNEKSKYCIEKNIISFKTGNINYTGQLNIEGEGVPLEFKKIKPSSGNSTFMYEGCQYLNWGSSSLNTPNILGVKRYNDGSYFRVVIPNNMSNEVVSEILSNKVIYGELKESEIIETNITEKITLPCYDGTTVIYTNGTSSHDEVNLPPIEELKGEITCTTLPLSTTAYIKPSTQYTMFMNTDCDVNYNLGGIEKEYKPTQGKILITTPSTLSNNTLTLLGEGNIGNVTLLEGDYTNSYVPDTFINDVFSVGELQEDGSYKVDIVSKNKNLAVIKNIDFPYTTVPTIVKNNEEKSIELRSSSGRDLLTKTNLNFKAGTTYTLSIKIETNNTNTSARIIVVDDINKQSSFGNNATTVLSINNPATTKTVTATFTPNVDSCLFLNLNNYANLSSETYMKFSEIIVLEGDFNEQDINYYEGKHEVKSISLPQPLRRVGDVCDRFYWDNTKGKMCIEKNVAEIDFSNFDFSPCPYVSGRFQITVPNMITGEGLLICNSIKAYGTNHGDLHGDTTDSNGYIVGAVAVGSDRYIVLRLGKGMTKDDSIQWLINHNTKIYHRIFPEIIETDITEPIEIDIFDTDTTITTTSTVNPNMYLKSDILSRPVTIKPSTKYYVYANTTGDIEVSLGGTKIQYTPNDIVKEITTPSNVTENIIGFVGDCEVSNVMLRTDNRTDIKYFNGVIYASILQDDGNYKTTINIMSNNSEEYDSFINIITSSPLESGSKIVVVDNEFKLLKANGEYEDIVSTDGNVVIDSNCKKICSCGEVNGITSLIVPYRSVRPLKAPINISFNNYTDNDNHTFIWDTDVGVEGHKFYYKDELVATIENPDPTYTYPSEMEGDVKIVAFNTLTESKGAVEDIITLPNRSEIVALNTIYDNGYKFTIVFNDNSNIRKGYKFIYSVDDGEENVIDIPVSDKAITLSQSIDVSEVSNNMKVRINSYNSVGEAEMKEKVFYLTPTPKWAYLLSSDNLMFRHQDKFPFTTYYKIKATNTQTLEENEYSYGSNQGINGLIIDYLLKSNREEELSVMLTMNDGYLDHIPCVPFKVSKTLDLSLVAPQNFTMEWVGDGIAKFSWDDNYTNEDYFEFV